MTATEIQPGDDLHLTSLMAPHSLNFVTGPDRAALLAYGRDVFAAARDSKCLAQIEEPAQPVAEICSASHDDAQFGERAIKPLCDISGFEYGTPLYAGAAPAAAAGTVEDHSAVLVAARDLISLRTEYAQKTQNAMPGNEYWGTRFDAKYQALAAALAAAPALQAPAAPARIVADALIRLDAIYREEADCDEPPQRPDWLVNALHLAAAAPQAPNCTRCSGSGEDPEGYLTHGHGPDDHTVDGPCRECDGTGAAPQAPAAPSVNERAAFEAWIKEDGGDLSTFGSGQNRHYNNSAVNNAWTGWCSRAALAAPAAPAVDAETEDLKLRLAAALLRDANAAKKGGA